MFKLIGNLFNLLSPYQRKRFFILQLLVILMSIVEILGVASIIPFMALVGDMSQLQQDSFFASLYKMSGITSESQFVFVLGICVLIMLFISMMISVFTIWGLSMFANKIGTEIADRLYAHYLNQDWLFHASGSSAQLTKKIATETMRVTGAILVPLMYLNSKVVLSLLMSISIFVYDPKDIACGTLLIGSLISVPFVILTNGIPNLAAFDLKFILILFGLSIAGTAVAYIVYFRILELAGAANLMLVTIIVPVFAILIDVILLQKWISLQIFLGFIVISFGLLLIDGRLLWAILKKLKSK